MGILLLNKVLFIILIMSILSMLRNVFFMVRTWSREKSDNETKFAITPKGLWILALSIGYVMMTIFTGISL